MLKNVLSRIGANLSNGRAKIIFGSLGWGNRKEIFSYARKLVEGRFSDVEFFEGDTVDEFKKMNLSRNSEKRACLLIDNIFERDDFTVLINQAFGNRNVTIIGISSFDPISVDYNKMTTIAGRYESYYLASHAFSEIPFDVDFTAYLSKGGLLFKDNEDYLNKSLARIEKEMNSRKLEALRGFFKFVVENSGRPWSERALSTSVAATLSPNTIGKYLDIYVENFLLYRLEGFDFLRMSKIGGNFRLYPFDTSLYGFSQREAAMHVDLLSMTPLIGRLKEEGYDCYYGYFHQQRMLSGGTRRYQDENVGIYATDGNRQLVFALNIGGPDGTEQNISRISPTAEKYIVESGKSPAEYDNVGVRHVGIEYLLGDEFDWRRR